MTFGEMLKKKRKELRWTQDILAFVLKVSVRTVNRYENSSVNPKWYKALDIAHAIGMDVDAVSNLYFTRKKRDEFE